MNRKHMYVISVIDPDESLSLFYVRETEREALQVADTLHRGYADEDNDTGFICVEKADIKSSEPAERLIQINLDEKYMTREELKQEIDKALI